MKNRHRFQNQNSSSGLLKPTTASTYQAKNNNGESASSKPKSSVEKTIETNIAVRPTRDEVAAIAYQIYLQEGRPEGRDLQHWLEAEAQLAASSPFSIKTEMTMKADIIVKNEAGTKAKKDKQRFKEAV